jgi:lysophospholipid acyltransferase (LPLAT)-like uncharacterized protein
VRTREVRLYYTLMAEAAKSGAGGEAQRLSSKGTPSSRLSFSRRVQIPIISGSVLALTRTLGPTLRFDVAGVRQIDRVMAGGRRCIFVFWHRCLFPLLWFARGRGIVILTSMNFDGQWSGRVGQHLGFGTVPGSSTRGGLRGLTLLAERVAQGHDAAFAIDGPRGPRYVAKPGPVLLARRTGCPILCLHVCPERAYTFRKAWDHFQIPYPFSRVAFVMGPPIEVPPEADRSALERKHAEMQQSLERTRAAAESWFTFPAAEREHERAFWDA